MNKGFIISTGWKRGKKNKSNHLFDTLTSTPKKGTNRRNKKANKKKGVKNFSKVI